MCTYQKQGFTIVELLIVIVVIAILAALGISAYNGTQERANISTIEDNLKKIDKGFTMYMEQQGLSSWPDDDNVVPGTTSPTIRDIRVNNPILAQYLPEQRAVGQIQIGHWAYDADPEETTNKTSCGNSYSGASIFISNITSSYAQKVDTQMDDGNLSCGKIRYDAAGTRLIYNLGNSVKYPSL